MNHANCVNTPYQERPWASHVMHWNMWLIDLICVYLTKLAFSDMLETVVFYGQPIISLSQNFLDQHKSVRMGSTLHLVYFTHDFFLARGTPTHLNRIPSYDSFYKTSQFRKKLQANFLSVLLSAEFVDSGKPAFFRNGLIS